MSSSQALDQIIINDGKPKKFWLNFISILTSNPNEYNIYLLYLFFRFSNFNQSFFKKLTSSDEPKQILLLDILDYIIDNGHESTLREISSNAFLKQLSFLIKIFCPNVKSHSLYLFQKWGLKYHNNKKYPNFFESYKNLSNQNNKFPNGYRETYEKYFSSNNSLNIDDTAPPSAVNDHNPNNSMMILIDDEPEEINYAQTIKQKLNPLDYDNKYQRLLLYLQDIIDTIARVNEIIDNSQRGSKFDEVKEKLNSLKNGKKTLASNIESEKLVHEKLMDFSIKCIDEIEHALERGEEFLQNKKPKPFLSILIEKKKHKDLKMEPKKNSLLKNSSIKKSTPFLRPESFIVTENENNANNYANSANNNNALNQNAGENKGYELLFGIHKIPEKECHPIDLWFK